MNISKLFAGTSAAALLTIAMAVSMSLSADAADRNIGVGEKRPTFTAEDKSSNVRFNLDDKTASVDEAPPADEPKAKKKGPSVKFLVKEDKPESPEVSDERDELIQADADQAPPEPKVQKKKQPVIEEQPEPKDETLSQDSNTDEPPAIADDNQDNQTTEEAPPVKKKKVKAVLKQSPVIEDDSEYGYAEPAGYDQSDDSYDSGSYGSCKN